MKKAFMRRRLLTGSAVILSLLITSIMPAFCDNRAEVFRLFNEANELRKQKRQAEAIVRLNSGLRIAPNDSAVLGLLGLCYFDQLKYREAFAYCSRAYSLCPEDTNMASVVAECYYQLKDSDKAIAFAIDYLAKHKTGDSIGSLWCTLGRAYAAKKQFPKSLEAFKNALRYEPNDRYIWSIMCSDLSDDKLAAPQLESVLPEFLRRFPDDQNAGWYKNKLASLKYQQERDKFENEAVSTAKKVQHDQVDDFVEVPAAFRTKVSPKFVAVVKQMVRKIPATIWQPLFAYGYRVHVVPFVVDDFTERDGDPLSQPRGYKKGATYKNVPALAMPHRKVLLVGEKFMSDEGTERLHEGPDRAMCHEMGHAYDEYLGNLSKKMNLAEKYDLFSSSKTFSAAHAEDAKAIKGEERERLSYYLQSGKVGAEELFANLFVYLWDNNMVEPGSNDELARQRFTAAFKTISDARSLDPEYIRLRDLYDSHVKSYPASAKK